MTAVEAAMRRAIELASRTNPHPNPRVGAVMVASDGSYLAEAVHHRAGEPHAERLLLDLVDDVPPDATLVVTLEPCAHTGRTPPCTDVILSAGVRRVVVGAADPDDRVSGAGIARLRGGGVEVVTGILSDEVEAMDPAYFHHRRTGRPVVVLKQATTLDGQIAAADGTSQWITSAEARADAHALRARHDGVLVGAGTARADDPRLDVRVEGYEGSQPRPIVVAGSRPLPAHLAIWERDPVVIASAESSIDATTVVRAGHAGVVDLPQALAQLPGLGILSVLVEGGAGIAASLLRSGQVTNGVLYLGAGLAGGTGRGSFDAVFGTLRDIVRVEITDVTRIGPDIRVDWRPGERGEHGS